MNFATLDNFAAKKYLRCDLKLRFDIIFEKKLDVRT